MVHDLKKDRGDHDFYRPLREAIVEMHKTGAGPEHLDALLTRIDDGGKLRLYPRVIAGYRKFMEIARPRWFAPPSGTFQIGEIRINVNAEIGLFIGGTPHIIKLHFRREKLTAKRVHVVTNILALACGGLARESVVAMLDVRKAKLHTLKAPNPRLNLLLRGEAAAFSTIYAAL